MSIAGIIKLNQLVDDLQAASKQLVNDAVVQRGAGWILELEREFPYAYGLLMSALYKEPVDVLRALAQIDPELRQLVNNQFALDYVRRIQLRIRGEHQ